jgi:hypothetical protein|tara:strand:- start:216 stop:425 length:210 start_codon:yes stop_codon:yes gene_type:complete
MASTLAEDAIIMWPYTDEENDMLSMPKKSDNPMKETSDWYWERYKSKCLNQVAPLEDLTETEQPFRHAA